MSISNGQNANATNFNNAFVSRSATQVIGGGKQFSAYIATNKEDVATTSTIAALSSSKSFVKMTGSTATTIQGIVAGVDGQRLSIFNASSANVTLSHENGTATAANRIKIFDATSLVIESEASADLVYDSTQSRWILISYLNLASTGSTTVAPTVQTFTSGSGTYTTPANVKYIRIRMVGGGGGGSRGAAAVDTGAGGGAGGYIDVVVNAPAATYAYSVGSGGNGATTTNTVGSAGGNTTFGANTANGGSGGGLGVGGAGGSTTISLGNGFGVAGGGGGGGINYTNPGASGGIGGSSFFGGAGRSTNGTSAAGGAAQTNSGSGGAGGASGNPTGNGGNGAAGLIIVEEYY